jgi:hypothetical protein
MKHSRKDYERFQDPAGKIPDDEPVFLLRAKDMYAAPAVAMYAMSILQDPFATPEAVAVAKRAKQWAEEMRAYGETHGVKRPDMPEGA